MRHASRRLQLVAAPLVGALLLAACGGSAGSPSAAPSVAAPSTAAESGAPEPTTAASPAASAAASPAAAAGRVVVYSGRSEELVGPILARFEEATGIDAEIRYAGTSELAALLLEEGDNSPADVFFAQDGGALGAVAAAGRLAALPEDLIGAVDPAYHAADGTWVGVTGRARVLAYDTRELAAADLPASVLDLADPAWKGRVGWVPTNASFQTFVTALRQTQGEEAARAWLEAMQANEPRVYDGNAAALQGVAAGEIDVALVNHYYLFQAQAESGTELPVANHFFTDGDPGALVNVAGVGILSTAPNAANAEALARFLVDEEAQSYFATETFEYPLATGATPDDRLPALAEIGGPDIDLSTLADLEGTLRLLQEAGVL